MKKSEKNPHSAAKSGSRRDSRENKEQLGVTPHHVTLAPDKGAQHGVQSS